MSLRAARHAVVVTPTGDNTERERGRLLVVANQRPDQKVYHGVVVDVGEHMSADTLEPGVLAYYVDFVEVEDKHIVDDRHLLCWDDESLS